MCALKTTVNYVNLQDLTLNITAHALHVGVNVQGTRRKWMITSSYFVAGCCDWVVYFLLHCERHKELRTTYPDKHSEKGKVYKTNRGTQFAMSSMYQCAVYLITICLWYINSMKFSESEPKMNWLYKVFHCDTIYRLQWWSSSVLKLFKLL